MVKRNYSSRELSISHEELLQLRQDGHLNLTAVRFRFGERGAVRGDARAGGGLRWRRQRSSALALERRWWKKCRRWIADLRAPACAKPKRLRFGEGRSRRAWRRSSA